MTLLEAIQKHIPSEAQWAKMPAVVARRLKPIRKKRVAKEFLAWAKDMGYEPQLESTMLRGFMFEAFAAGWGARGRQVKPSGEVDKTAVKLLKAAAPHVYRQQHAGQHAQDKVDAKKLYPKISKYLKGL